MWDTMPGVPHQDEPDHSGPASHQRLPGTSRVPVFAGYPCTLTMIRTQSDRFELLHQCWRSPTDVSAVDGRHVRHQPYLNVTRCYRACKRYVEAFFARVWRCFGKPPPSRHIAGVFQRADGCVLADSSRSYGDLACIEVGLWFEI